MDNMAETEEPSSGTESEYVDNEPEEEVVAKKQAVAKPKKVAVSSTTSSLPSGFIISYASNGNEATAKNNVKILKQKGYKASYYFMPDKKAGSPSLYKVYVGPYNDETEALPDFKKIVQLNNNAYILNVN